MTTITVEVPDAVAREIRGMEDRLSEALATGIRELRERKKAAHGSAAEIFAFFAGKPTPEEIVALRPSRAFHNRIEALLAKNRAGQLSADERAEWDEYELVEHLVRVAKAKANVRLNKR